MSNSHQDSSEHIFLQKLSVSKLSSSSPLDTVNYLEKLPPMFVPYCLKL
ncbi:MAG: hypothetical protein F6K65_41400 [Moorea sp. SIO3C2]|nr:hypothetical protein [Moorena sp. SIO3C2]